MSQLTEISVVTRKIAIWMVILFICYIVLKVMFGLFVEYWKTTHPAIVEIPPPNTLFGKLPNPRFTHIATSSSGMKFILENVSGNPVVDPPQEATAAGKVYLMPKKMPSLLASDRAKKFATKLLFTNEPEILTQTYFRFTDPEESLRTLEIDITNLNFHLKYDYLKKISLFDNTEIPSKDDTLKEVKNFISANYLFDDSILKGKTTTDYLYFDSKDMQFHSASSLSTANTIRVNFFRNDLDNMKILPPDYNHSFNYVIFSGGQNLNTRILEINYIFWPIAFDDFGTYPIRSGETAWKDLLDGYAIVVNMGYNSPEKIVIRKISLAYYDSDQPQRYMQPIYVFEGDNDFVAYLPAVTTGWLE